jgi:hypothetical protein
MPQEEAPQTSLPAPSGSEIVELKPAEEPAPPEIGYSEAVRQISRLYPDNLRPFRVRDRIPIVLHDLDNDQHPECLSLAIPSQGIDSKLIGRLGDSSRLFEEDVEPIPFFLLVFTNKQGNFRRLNVLDIGEHFVFESLDTTNLYATRSLPVIITVSFQTVEGREVELLVFDSGSGLPRYRHTLTETLSTKHTLEDIDGNGMMDLFVKEKAMEEGTGFETFLIWYRWNGRDFVEYRTRNVVRNLNSYLEEATDLLLAGDLQDTVHLLVEPSRAKAFRRKGWSNDRILIHTLGLEEVGITAFPSLREVVFPVFLEDPFLDEDDRGFSFDITYRMIDLNGTSYIAKSRLYMLTNPFNDRQFAFTSALD